MEDLVLVLIGHGTESQMDDNDLVSDYKDKLTSYQIKFTHRSAVRNIKERTATPGAFNVTLKK